MPRFTIIMPCRNAAATLAYSIGSLSAQDFDDWNAVIVDDGSTDRTPQMLEAAACDPRITVIRAEGVGPARARNMAAGIADGEWLAFFDADDVWPEDRLSALSRAIDAAPGAGAFYGRCGFFADDHHALTATSRVKPRALTAADALGENPTCTMSNLVVSAESWRRVGGQDENMIFAEDLDLLVRLIALGVRIESVNRILTFYRLSPSGLSADLEAMEQGWRLCFARASALGLAAPGAGAAAEARQLRYLARRALRLGLPGAAALRFALRGAMRSPIGFFGDFRRGAATFAAAIAAPFTPKRIARALFAR